MTDVLPGAAGTADDNDDPTCHTCVDDDHDEDFTVAPLCCTEVCEVALGATRTALKLVRFTEPAMTFAKASCTADAVKAEEIDDIARASCAIDAVESDKINDINDIQSTVPSIRS